MIPILKLFISIADVKSFVLALIFSVFAISIYSQNETTWPEIINTENHNYWDVKEAFYEWYNIASMDSVGNDTIHLTPHYKHFKRFESHYENKLDGEGTFNTYTQKIQEYYSNHSNSSNNCIPKTLWKFASFEEVPPNSHWAKGMGIVSDLWVNPSNNQHILAASNTAGLWKTIDGGQNWENITDTLGLSFGVSTIAVDPNNYNIIYIGTGFRTATTQPYGLGVFKSLDGGITWNQTSISFGGNNHAFIEKIIINPDTPNTAYAICNRRWHFNTPNGIYKTTDGFQTHTFKYIYFPSDIIFQPGNPQTIYVFAKDSLYRSINGGQSWQGSHHSVFDKDPLCSVFKGRFATHDSLPNFLLVHYAKVSLCNNSTTQIDVSHDKGMTWNNLVNNTSTNHYKLEVRFSPTDTSVFYVGNIRLWQYNRNNNGGISSRYIINQNTNSTDPYWMHSDVRDIKVFKDSSGKDKIYIGHDGGVSYSNGDCTGNFLCWKLISGKGLNITQYHGVAIHDHDTNVFYGGAQDGNGARTLDDGQSWQAGMLTDAGDLLLDHQNTNKRALFEWGHAYHYKKFGQEDGSTPGAGKFGGRLAYHPNGTDSMYAGVNHLMIWDPTIIVIPPKDDKWEKVCKIAGTTRGNYVNAFSICESEPKNIIVATDKNTEGTTNYQNILFKTSVANPDPISDWTDITPHETSLYWGKVSAIEMDPMNPNRVWIGFSGFGSHRVVYSNDGGATATGWTDFSAGLPDLPIQELNYQIGSNDLMYAATDVGLFYRNADMSQWECFNNGLPPGVVNDIDISYCTRRMIASVYGRGAWDNKILNIPWHLSQNTTWDENRWLSVNLHIDSGVVLTIKDTLLMYPDVSIIVEKGGKLVIDGGHLRSACYKQMWEQIEVRGDRSLSQKISGNQGVLILNNAIIEDFGSISMIKLNDENEYQWNYTGGIIKAENTIFRNCYKAVEFLSYENKYNGILYDNHSYFKNCTFETTALLKTDKSPIAFVTLHDVDGIKFVNCTFRNTVPQLFTENERGGGIVSWDATYNILPGCSNLSNSSCPPQNIQKCKFENLYYGIEARAINPMHPFLVEYAKFDNCIRGIYQSGINYATINRSVFKVPTPSNYDTYGIYLEQCVGYQVEENDFTGTLANNSSGLCIYNSGAVDNEIYNNSFYQLQNAILVMSLNGVVQSPGDGLVLLCNDFVENNYSIALTEEGVIDYHQGGNNFPAGNTFEPDCIGSNNELFVNNNSYPYIYFHHSEPFTEPLCHSNGVILMNTNISYEEKNVSCPSQLDPYPFCSDCVVPERTSGKGSNGFSSNANTLALNQKQINNIIRYHLKDTILGNGLNKIVSFLKKQNGNFNQTILAATELRLKHQKSYLAEAAVLRDSTHYSFLIKVLDWNTSNSKVTPSLKQIAQSHFYGSSHAKNAIAWESGKKESEILIYPQKVQKRLKNDRKTAIVKTVQLIPNPADLEVTLYHNFGTEGKRKLLVYNSNGSIVFETFITEAVGKKKINTSAWTNGLYLFKINDQGKTKIIKKLLISK